MRRLISWSVFFVVCEVSLGCAASARVPRVAPPETVAGPRASQTEGARQERSSVYAKKSVCSLGHANAAGAQAADDSGCCRHPGPRAWVAEPVPLGDKAELQPGYVATACGPEPPSGDDSRERSLNPSEALRPGNQVLHVGW